ncbi:GntR family transcriptional regulator [Scrofimicrobium sp. R131]|uniref:GntR family transcriptional regulator n=1 Tax=Scrofimicrobium appendicitidis TaxID=3079930 RepID=A0AAU7V977_9ACTO
MSVPVTQAEHAYTAIRTAIISGQLSAGARVYQSEWAEALGISVTPVREAIRRLEQEGLLNVTPHRDVTVSELSLAGAEEIYAMRLRVEPLQMEKSIEKFTKSASQQALSLCRQMDTTHDIIEFTYLNQQFHRTLLSYDDSWTARVTEMLEAAAAPYVALSLRKWPAQIKDSNAQHFQLLSAFDAGDLATAIEVGHAHLTSTLEALRKGLS